jgi:molecular chaperone DnaK
MAIYGIDLGTTYCALSRLDIDRDPVPAPVEFPGLGTAFPSLVLLEPGVRGPRAIVGTGARRRFLSLSRGRADPPPGVHLIRGSKNHMGSGARIEDGPPWTCGAHEFFPTDIAAMILRGLRERVRTLGYPPLRDVVITHPQKFNNRQRVATQQAGEMAGLNVLGVITEPDAAAWAYEHHDPHSTARRVLVFDFGGGTLDVVAMERSSLSRACPDTRVLASYGKECGGLRIDEIVRECLIEAYTRQHRDQLGEDFTADEEFNAWTREEFLFLAEKLKRDLNDENSAQDPAWESQSRFVRIEHIEAHARRKFPPLAMRVRLGEYAAWIGGVLNDAMQVVARALSLADPKLREEDIDEVRMTGQSSQLVPMRKRLEERFRRVVIHTDPRSYLHPAVIVASGAALYGTHLLRRGGAPQQVQGAAPEPFYFASGGTGKNRRYHRMIERGAKTATPYQRVFEVDLSGGPLPGDGKVLPFEVFEGDLFQSIGRFELDFKDPLTHGQKVDVTMELAANGRFTMAVDAGGERRVGRLSDAEGVYREDEFERRKSVLQGMELDVED